MKAAIKKIIAASLSALMCLSLAACATQNPDSMSITSLHEYLGKSENDVLSYLKIEDDKIESRNEGNEQVDIILSDSFEYDGANAKVKFLFVKDCLYSVEYIFTEETDDALKAAYNYSKDIEKKFDQEYKKPEDYTFEPSITDLTQDTFISSENQMWRNDWIIDDRNNAIEKLGSNNEDPQLTAALQLIKAEKTAIVKIFLWA